MNPLNLTTNINANAEAEETQWAMNLPNHKGTGSKPEKLNKSNLDYADECYFAGLKDKTE